MTTPGPFLVEGTLRRQQDAVHLEVYRLAPFHQRKRPFTMEPRRQKSPFDMAKRSTYNNRDYFLQWSPPIA